MTPELRKLIGQATDADILDLLDALLADKPSNPEEYATEYLKCTVTEQRLSLNPLW